MKKYLVIIPALLLFFSGAWAQNQTSAVVKSQEKKGMPDLPGNFTFDFGWNIANNRPSEIGTSWWGSRVVNLAYFYEFPLGKSKRFTFRPGIGIGWENLKFSDGRTLYVENGKTEMIDFAEFQIKKTGRPLSEGGSIEKSKLASTFIDIPLEIGYDIRPESKNSFRVALGGKVGYRISSHTKVVYKNGDSGDTERFKQEANFNLSDFRYGYYFRFGFNWINLYYYQNLSPVFKSGKGPGEGGTDMSTSQLGFSFNLF